MTHKLASALAAIFNFFAMPFDQSNLHQSADLNDEATLEKLEHDATVYSIWMY